VITHRCDSAIALGGALASRVLDAIDARPGLVVGLPTGHTPLPFYAALRSQTRERGTDWSGVRTFNVDEFVALPADSPGSYRAYMQRELFGPVGIDTARAGFLDGNAPDLAAECARYERAIAEAGGIDILILGIGANGHIGFNEPATQLEPRTHLVQLTDATRAANRAWFDDALERVPRAALSMGMATLLHARAIVLMATGPTKLAAVERMVKGPITTRLPASFLQLHPDVTVMLDPAASPR
jgi:glucosamine-6-phosphate deaminase